MSKFEKGLKYFLKLTHKNVNGRKLFCLAILIALITMGNLQIMAQEIHYKTQAELEMEKLEKLKTLRNSFAISLHYGYFELLPFAKASENTTNIDISDYHSMFNIEVEYYPYEKVAGLFSIGLIAIPPVQSIDDISFEPGSGLGGIKVEGSGQGGAILPVTFGVKKTFLNGLARPYVSLSSGVTFIKIGTGTGTGSINGIEKNIDYQSQLTFCYQLGTGVQLRAGKVIRFDFGINYYGSPKFSTSIGGMESFQGLYVFGGMNIILNPGK